PARPSMTPVRPRVAFNIIFGMLLGLVLGVTAAFVVEYQDRRIKTEDDLVLLHLPMLGMLPIIPVGGTPKRGRHKQTRSDEMKAGRDQRDLYAFFEPKSPVAECVRAIRTNLLFMSPDEPLKTILVTSAEAREGKTTVLTSLGIAMAQAGNRVLLV